MRGFMQDRLLKIKSVHEKLNCSRAQAYRLIQEKQIPAVKIGKMVRVKESDLETFIDEHRN
jgi:excisionase family DNA binding protein